MSLTVAPPALRQALTFLPTCSICARISPLPTTLLTSSRATCPPPATQCPPSRSATLVVAGEEAQGGPTISGAANFLPASPSWHPCLIGPAAFSRHTGRPD